MAGTDCRHSFIPFNPETMTNNLKQYGMEENKEMYENHQKQRYFERNIRKYKRLASTEKAALNATTDPETINKIKSRETHYRKLATKWNKRYKEFSKQNNLRTQPERTRIAR